MSEQNSRRRDFPIDQTFIFQLLLVTHTETDTDRHTHRHTQTKTDRQTQTNTQRHTHTLTQVHILRHIKNVSTNRQTQTHTHTVSKYTCQNKHHPKVFSYISFKGISQRRGKIFFRNRCVETSAVRRNLLGAQKLENSLPFINGAQKLTQCVETSINTRNNTRALRKSEHVNILFLIE